MPYTKTPMQCNTVQDNTVQTMQPIHHSITNHNMSPYNARWQCKILQCNGMEYAIICTTKIHLIAKQVH